MRPDEENRKASPKRMDVLVAAASLEKANPNALREGSPMRTPKNPVNRPQIPKTGRRLKAKPMRDSQGSNRGVSRDNNPARARKVLAANPVNRAKAGKDSLPNLPWLRAKAVSREADKVRPADRPLRKNKPANGPGNRFPIKAQEVWAEAEEEAAPTTWRPA